MLSSCASVLRSLRTRTRTGWIGIDLGSEQIKLAQIESVRGKLRIAAAAIIPVPGPNAYSFKSLAAGWLTECIKGELGSHHGFQGRNAACVLTMSSCDFRSVSLPPATYEEARELVSHELVDAGMGVESLEFDFWSSPASGNSDPTMTVNVLSLGSDVAKSLSRELWKAGLICRTLDGSPFALARSVGLMDAQSAGERTVAVLDWGATCAQFTVIVEGEPVFTRLFKECGVRNVIEVVQNGLELPAFEAYGLLSNPGLLDPSKADDPESEVQRLITDLTAEPFARLSSEIDKTMSFLRVHRPELTPKVLRVVGGGGNIRNIEPKLSKSAGIPAHRGTFPGALAMDSKVFELPVELFAQAAALSQLGLAT